MKLSKKKQKDKKKNHVIKQMTDVKLGLIRNNTWNRLTACKKIS